MHQNIWYACISYLMWFYLKLITPKYFLKEIHNWLLFVNANAINANFLNEHYNSYKCMQIQMPTYRGKKYKKSIVHVYWLSTLYPVSHCIIVNDDS